VGRRSTASFNAVLTPRGLPVHFGPCHQVQRGLPPPSHPPSTTLGRTVLSHHAPCLAHQKKGRLPKEPPAPRSLRWHMSVDILFKMWAEVPLLVHQSHKSLSVMSLHSKSHVLSPHRGKQMCGGAVPGCRMDAAPQIRRRSPEEGASFRFGVDRGKRADFPQISEGSRLNRIQARPRFGIGICFATPPGGVGFGVFPTARTVRGVPGGGPLHPSAHTIARYAAGATAPQGSARCSRATNAASLPRRRPGPQARPPQQAPLRRAAGFSRHWGEDCTRGQGTVRSPMR